MDITIKIVDVTDNIKHMLISIYIMIIKIIPTDYEK